MNDIKSRVFREWEATGDGPYEIARRIGCDVDYARFLVNLARGSGRMQEGVKDRAYIVACLRQGGFPWAVARRTGEAA